MSAFILSKEGESGRVILDAETHGEILQAIEAGNWLEARAKVDESALVRVDGHGWFA